jgi:hypothetical protein
MSRSAFFCGLSGERSRDTRIALPWWGMPRPIDFNGGINIFTAEKTAPPVYLAEAPQSFICVGNHEPLAARTTHRHRIYFPFGQISTIACTLPSCGLIIWSIPLCAEVLLKNVA